MAVAADAVRQARTAFDAFAPAELPASKDERLEFIKRAKAAQGNPVALLVAEDRAQPLAAFDELPEPWLERNASTLASLRGGLPWYDWGSSRSLLSNLTGT